MPDKPAVGTNSKSTPLSSSAPMFGAYPQLMILGWLIAKAFRAITGRGSK
jgi:hypothetical protein